MPTIDPARMYQLLGSLFEGEAESLSFIGAGMFSQAYSFRAGGRELILRLNTFEQDFRKDALAATLWTGPDLPVPEIIAIGRFDERLHYAISERAPGTTLATKEASEMLRLIPALFASLDAMRAADVSGYSGWGLTDEHGNGMFPSWSEYLLAGYNQKFDYDWDALASHEFFEIDIYRRFREEMASLLRYAPAERYLVHGDFGSDNAIAEGEQITGIIDWAESRLGDFLFDIACIDFWSAGIPYGRLWSDHAERRGLDIPCFEERMRCYQLHIGMEGMMIAATLNDREDYEMVRNRTYAALAGTAAGPRYS